MVVRIYYYSGYPIYIFCKMTKKPYVGSYLFSDQEAGRERLKITKLILKKIKKKKIKILELGVFCGQNTLSISRENLSVKVDHFCVDLFNAYEISDINNDFRYKKCNENLRNQNIYNLFSHNLKTIKKERGNIRFFVKKMSTRNFFVKNSKKFDLIIIDASHQFNFVYKDIISSKKILNNNGFIIGDDYEVESKNFSFSSLYKNKNSDLIYSKRFNKYYHPGVALAVKRIFKNLKSKNGLFCLQKKNKKFIDFFN